MSPVRHEKDRRGDAGEKEDAAQRQIPDEDGQHTGDDAVAIVTRKSGG